MTALLERVVGGADEGERVDVALAVWLDEPRAAAQRRLVAGEVAVDGVEVAKSHRLVMGERVVVTAPTVVPEVAAPPPVDVRWRDEHLAVVVKPAGLVTHPGAGVSDGTLVHALHAMRLELAGGPSDRPGIVHRLDRGTSGLLAVALSEPAFQGLSALMREHDVRREYAAIVDGVPDSPLATIEAPVGRDPTRRTRFRVDQTGRRAVTHYDVREAFADAALLAVRLETGRTHQVRVHLSAVGHPVSGDVAYGASRALATRLELSRPALHARRLAFRHPVTGEAVDVAEPLPVDLERALALLRGVEPAEGG